VNVMFFSGPQYFDHCVKYYLENPSLPSNRNFIDTSAEALVRTKLDEALIEVRRSSGGVEGLEPPFILRNTDVQPLLHAQTLGHVSAFAEHIEPRELAAIDPDFMRDLEADIKLLRDPSKEFFGTKIFGVNISPTLGGWFVYRYVVVFPTIQCPMMPKPIPLKFLSLEQKRFILREFNLAPSVSHWRDIPGSESNMGYSAEAYLYFHTTDPRIRHRYFELKMREHNRRKSQEQLKSVARSTPSNESALPSSSRPSEDGVHVVGYSEAGALPVTQNQQSKGVPRALPKTSGAVVSRGPPASPSASSPAGKGPGGFQAPKSRRQAKSRSKSPPAHPVET
jgi:hypothetical protein